MKVLHLTASRFFGGPERQMLGLAQALAARVETFFASFSEEGLNTTFLDRVSKAGFAAIDLAWDTPYLLASMREIGSVLRNLQIDVLTCHGYKAGFVGCYAARKSGIPVVAVSRGWTAENLKVRCYERLDRWMLKRMKKVICVSEAQSRRVEAAGIRHEKIEIIRNSVLIDRFQNPIPEYRTKLLQFFPRSIQSNRKFVIGAAGRLSIEKGFDVLIRACRDLANECELDFGVVLFGDGVLRTALQKEIDSAGLNSRFILAGFTSELDHYMPHLDLFVQSSHTEGLPNVLLEAAAAGIPVVATDVGGTREVVVDGVTGLIVPRNDDQALGAGICQLLTDNTLRAAMKLESVQNVARHFTFAAQANAYHQLFCSITNPAQQAA